MRLLCLASAVALFIPVNSLSAQLPAIEPGARVRVTAPDCGMDKQATTVESSRGDTLVLDTMVALGLTKSTECPLASVTRLDVSQGKRISAGRVIGSSMAGARYLVGSSEL